MCMHYKNSTTTHIINCIIVIKMFHFLNVKQCGEKYYTDEIAEHLELIIDMAKN